MQARLWRHIRQSVEDGGRCQQWCPKQERVVSRARNGVRWGHTPVYVRATTQDVLRRRHCRTHLQINQKGENPTPTGLYHLVWCTCTNCQVMPSQTESICCQPEMDLLGYRLDLEGRNLTLFNNNILLQTFSLQNLHASNLCQFTNLRLK